MRQLAPISLIASILAAACAIAAPAAASNDAADQRQLPSNVRTAFNDGCDWAFSIDALPGDVESRGWRPYVPEPGSEMANRVQTMGGEPAVFERAEEGRRIFLTIAAEGERSHRCTVYDFDATERPALDVLVPWFGGMPTGEIGGYGEPNWGSYWEPGLEGHDSLEVYFVPPGSPLIEQSHIRGMIYTGVRTESADSVPSDSSSYPIAEMLAAFDRACLRPR